MSTSAVSDFAGPDADRLRDALGRAAALLATDGRLAGPASVQENFGELIPSDDASAVYTALDDGTALVALIVPAAVGGTDPTSVLSSVVAAAAAELGAPMGDVLAFDRAEDLLTHLTQAHEALADLPVVGAGIFEGDAVVATVGAIITGSGSAVGGSVFGAPGAVPTPTSSTAGAGSAVLERGLQLLADIELTVTAELGRARLAVGELLDLQPGAIIELDREAGVPIDVLVNGTLFARGEVVVVEDSFAVRVSEIVTDEGSS